MALVQQILDDSWDFNDPALSERRFRESLSKHQSLPDKLELRTQIARALGLQRRFDEALASLDEIERELATHESDANFGNARVRLLLERGRVFNSNKDRTRALPLFEQAFETAKLAGNDHLAIDTTHMITIVHGSEKRNDQAMQWNLTALSLAESSSQPRARQWRGSLHNNLGWTMHDQGRFTEALEHFERALQCRIEENKPREIRVARWCIARALRSLGRTQEALDAQESLQRESQSSGQQSDGFVSEEIGECLLALGRDAEAAPHFARAHELLSRDAWLAANEPARLARLAQLGRPQPTNRDF